jgi:hypothetical protein
MPKCIRCGDMLPPQFMVDLELEVALDPIPQQCVFCKEEIKEINLETAGGSKEKYTKEEAKKEYMIFLNMLKEKAESLHKVLKGDAGFEPKTTVM